MHACSVCAQAKPNVDYFIHSLRVRIRRRVHSFAIGMHLSTRATLMALISPRTHQVEADGVELPPPFFVHVEALH